MKYLIRLFVEVIYIKDLLLVQFFPFEKMVGRFKYTTIDNKYDYEYFVDLVNASDVYHKSVILCIDMRNHDITIGTKEMIKICCEILGI